MDELSAAELAARAGVPEREIERMVDLGILSPQAITSSFRPPDVQVWRPWTAPSKCNSPTGEGTTLRVRIPIPVPAEATT